MWGASWYCSIWSAVCTAGNVCTSFTDLLVRISLIRIVTEPTHVVYALRSSEKRVGRRAWTAQSSDTLDLYTLARPGSRSQSALIPSSIQTLTWRTFFIDTLIPIRLISATASHNSIATPHERIDASTGVHIRREPRYAIPR